MSAIASNQIKAIHASARTAGLDDETRRDLIARETGGKRSSKALTYAEADRVLTALNRLSGSDRDGIQGASKRARLDGPYVSKMRALWLSAYNLGLVRERDDAALTAFVKRQCGLDHMNWVRDWDSAVQVIEALKSWIERDGGVVWPTDAFAKIGIDAWRTAQGLPSARVEKLAVLRRQSALVDAPAEPIGATLARLRRKAVEALEAGDLDFLMSHWGREIRRRSPE